MPDLQVSLNRPQSFAHRASLPGHSVCAPWGRGIGKSWYLRTLWYLLVSEWDHVLRKDALDPFRGVRITHVMPTFKASVDVHSEQVEAELGPGGKWAHLGAKINHSTWKITFPGGSYIQWFGAREANASRGIRTDVGTFDECDDIDPSVVDAVSAPWFSEPWSLRLRYFGGTPRRGRYGLLYREHRAGLEGDRARGLDLSAVTDIAERERLEALRKTYSFHATYRDAPETVDAGYVAELKAKTLPEVFKREWECNFDSAEGLVYGVFRESYHVREPDPRIRFTEYLVGVDHGYEHPGTFIVVGVQGSGQDAVLWVLDEVYQQHQVESWWVEAAKVIDLKYRDDDRLAKWFADPSQPARIEALKKQAGLGGRISNALNAIEDGVAAVADRIAVRVRETEKRCEACDSAGCAACAGRIGYARLYVSPKCKNTIREFGAYRRKRDPRDPERTLDTIVDKDNDAMDGLKYAVFSRFGAPSHGRVTTGAGW